MGYMGAIERIADLGSLTQVEVAVEQGLLSRSASVQGKQPEHNQHAQADRAECD